MKKNITIFLLLLCWMTGGSLAANYVGLSLPLIGFSQYRGTNVILYNLSPVTFGWQAGPDTLIEFSVVSLYSTPRPASLKEVRPMVTIFSGGENEEDGWRSGLNYHLLINDQDNGNTYIGGGIVYQYRQKLNDQWFAKYGALFGAHFLLYDKVPGGDPTVDITFLPMIEICRTL